MNIYTKASLVLASLVALIPAALGADGVASGKAELIAADTAFSARSSEVGMLKAFLEFATAETKVLSQAGKGFDAVRSEFSSTPAAATLTWKPSEAEVSSSGDLGYTWGRYEYREPGANGKPVVGTGTYVTIWRRQADASWKVALDGGTPDPKSP
jgi:ketosteroid isomerase-like protein